MFFSVVLWIFHHYTEFYCKFIPLLSLLRKIGSANRKEPDRGKIGTLTFSCARRGNISPMRFLSLAARAQRHRGKILAAGAFIVMISMLRHFASSAACICALAAAFTSFTRITISTRSQKRAKKPPLRQKAILIDAAPLRLYLMK